MIRVLAALMTLVSAALPVFSSPTRVVAAIGLVGVMLAAAAIIAYRRWPATAAACVFLVQYAGAVWLQPAPVPA